MNKNIIDMPNSSTDSSFWFRFSSKQLLLGGFLLPPIIGGLVALAWFGKTTLNFNSQAEEHHIRGNKNAPVKLVEFSDFQCPFCGRHYPTLKQILKDYGDKVSLEYKHFPLSFHPNAGPAAEASECAAEQGKFWEFHDIAFENQNQLSIAELSVWAKNIGLDMNQFNRCFAGHTYAAKVEAEYQEGQKLGVNGTPATFVNGKLISGAEPIEALKQVIDAALKK